jgi:hypothetical protein
MFASLLDSDVRITSKALASILRIKTKLPTILILDDQRSPSSISTMADFTGDFNLSNSLFDVLAIQGSFLKSLKADRILGKFINASLIKS